MPLRCLKNLKLIQLSGGLAELGSLLIAISNYGAEAEICYNSEAYLASCVMLAATIEGYLVILTRVLPEEAQQALQQLQKAKQIDKRLKLSSLLEWDLGQLLKVAKQANWLPSEIAANPLLDPDDISNPLSTGRIRELRNLIHLGRLVKARGGRTITKEELDTLHATCTERYERIFGARSDEPDGHRFLGDFVSLISSPVSAASLTSIFNSVLIEEEGILPSSEMSEDALQLALSCLSSRLTRRPQVEAFYKEILSYDIPLGQSPRARGDSLLTLLETSRKFCVAPLGSSSMSLRWWRVSCWILGVGERFGMVCSSEILCSLKAH